LISYRGVGAIRTQRRAPNTNDVPNFYDGIDFCVKRTSFWGVDFENVLRHSRERGRMLVSVSLEYTLSSMLACFSESH
jgi:hypothetical protein